MGTRADFYIVRKYVDADKISIKRDWIGSLYRDGHPWNIPTDILIQINPVMFEELTVEFLESSDSRIALKGDRWPWPWPDSSITDYTYIFGGYDLDRVVGYSSTTKKMFDPLKVVQGEDMKTAEIPGVLVIPKMSKRMDQRSIKNYGSESAAAI